MSSFLVNFQNFFNARKDRDAQEAARQQQASQFFAQLAQQKELAEQAAAARRYEYDTSQAATEAATERDRAENQQRQVLEAQAQGLLRPAGSAEDPITGNPFLIGGQEVVATSPVERARAMLPVEEERARLAQRITDDFQESRRQRDLKLLEDVKAVNPIFQKIPALYEQARMSVMMGKNPADINISEAAMASMLSGDEETTRELISLTNQMNAWRTMTSWQGPSGDNLLFNRKVQSLYGQVIGAIPPDAAQDQASQAAISLQVLAELEKRGGLDPSVVGAVREKLQQDRLSGAGAASGEDDMAKRLKNLTLEPIVRAMEEKRRQQQFGMPLAPGAVPAASPSSRGDDFLMGPRR